MTARKPIVVVGSINIDLVTRVAALPAPGETIVGKSFDTSPGGKGANQAVAVARLGYPVSMIGRVGNDVFGSRLLHGLQQTGIDTDAVRAISGSSGVAMILVADDGENCIVITPGANGLLRPDDLNDQLNTIQSAGLVLCQLEIPMDTVKHLAYLCHREGVPFMLDPAPALPIASELFSRITWFTPNETEAAFYTHRPSAVAVDAETTAAKLLARGVKGVALKLGSKGAFAKTQDGSQAWMPAFSVASVDSTAAGDAFNGAFATGLMMGKSIEASVRFAAAAAALSVTRVGAQASMPSMTEVEQLLSLSDS